MTVVWMGKGRLGVVAWALTAGLVVTGCASGAEPGEAASAALATTPGAEVSSAPALPDLVLPEEQDKPLAEYTDWETDDAVDQAWLVDACRPTDYPTDRQRVGFRTTSRTGPEVQDARQLAVYPSAEVATEALDGFRRALTACATGTTPAGSRWEWTFQDVPDLGDDGLVAASTVGGDQMSPSGDRVALTRVGEKLLLTYAGGEAGTAEIDGGADEQQQIARRLVERL